MIQLILTEEQQRLLDQSSEPVQILDRSGRVLSKIGSWFSEAEIATAKKRSENFQPAGTFGDLLEKLRGQVADDSSQTHSAS